MEKPSKQALESVYSFVLHELLPRLTNVEDANQPKKPPQPDDSGVRTV